MEEKKCLIVDDSATMRQLLVMAVKKLDGKLKITEAVDGQDGYNKFQQGQFDFVLTDIKMPNMTGLELVEKLRKESINPSIPIVIISTKGEESDIEAGMKLGANEYLLKPISTMKLKEVVTKFLTTG